MTKFKIPISFSDITTLTSNNHHPHHHQSWSMAANRRDLWLNRNEKSTRKYHKDRRG
ncbi:hypothetical protein B9Z19DRAFT_1081576 [Tuber borchii]|uniref:Uncharacterized protein n=1 Tax=Tuber borchii TaxID=42251 RepID=A0A2T6ZVI8_TUBBO|nr:hypothetical protein B9Z19DRAFT_1081576 [Tuber borchii]